jgi:hypothetical protein
MSIILTDEIILRNVNEPKERRASPENYPLLSKLEFLLVFK